MKSFECINNAGDLEFYDIDLLNRNFYQEQSGMYTKYKDRDHNDDHVENWGAVENRFVNCKSMFVLLEK